MSKKFLIKNKDRVVFWGDSITDNACWCRTIENYVRCRFPEWKVDFFNLGWGGDRTSNWKRAERDIPPFKPTIVFIKLGMNDAEYKPFDQNTCDTYITGMKNLVKVIRKYTKARIVLITSIPYEENCRPDNDPLNGVYVDTLRKFSLALINFANENNIPVLDLNIAYLETITSLKKENPLLKFSPDGIHPDITGNALMAFCLLKLMNADGKISSLEIDIKKKKIISEGYDSCSFEYSEDGIKIFRKNPRPPFKVSGQEALTLDPSLWFKDLNRVFLKITGLNKPWILIESNDVPLGLFKKEEIENGINMSLLPLEESEIGNFISELVAEKHFCRYKLWREIKLKNISNPSDFTPYKKEGIKGWYLKQKAELALKTLHSSKIYLSESVFVIKEMDSPILYPDAPFKVIPPYPAVDEVQILFRIDTTLWKNIIPPGSKTPLDFVPPLKIKGEFNNWKLISLHDDGLSGDEKPHDGIWSVAVNVKRSLSPVSFAFDDASPVRSNHESLLMETLKTAFGKMPETGKNAHPYFVPDSHKIVDITSDHFKLAVKRGLIKQNEENIS